jgi:hypothetical protein
VVEDHIVRCPFCGYGSFEFMEEEKEERILNHKIPPDVQKDFDKLDSGVYDKINRPIETEQLDLFGETQ